MLPATYSIRGVGGSPAVVGNRVYFTSVHGRVYCLDTTTMTSGRRPLAPLWVTDLKHPDLPHNQPLDNRDADCWSGPLMVRDRVYVGCGEGETPDASGFVYCLDADSGDVVWLFCTNQFQGGVDNQLNVVPDTLVPPPGTLPPGFTSFAVPANWVRGASVWSSLAYYETLDRVYVGTGDPSPDRRPLTRSTPAAAFPWIHAPASSGDQGTQASSPTRPPTTTSTYLADLRLPRRASLARGDQQQERCVRDPRRRHHGRHRPPPDPATPEQGRNTPSPGTSLPRVVPFFGFPIENHYGVYGTPAHSGGRLFVTWAATTGSLPYPMDSATRTRPVVRVMHDRDRGTARALQDAWPTVADAFGITRYSNASPPMYTTSETGLGSAAVVNDVVFACTGLGFGGARPPFTRSTSTPAFPSRSPRATE